MNETSLVRLAPLSGALAVVLLLLATVTFGVYDYLPSGESVQATLTARSGRVVMAGYLGGLAAVSLLWFAGSVYAYLKPRERGSGRLALLAFGGGATAAAALALSFTVMIGAAMRAGSPDGIDPVAAVVAYDLWANIFGEMFAFALAVMIAASARVVMSTSAWPGWAGWVSILIAVGLLTPFAYIVLAAAIVWLLVVSVVSYRQAEPATERR